MAGRAGKAADGRGGMMKDHPRELDIARWGDGGAGEEIREHVRWCADCRRILAEYEWLQGEVREALRSEAARAPVLGPDWEGVQRRLRGAEGGGTEQRAPGGRGPGRLGGERRPLVAAGVALILCVMVMAPAVLGREVEAQSVAGTGLSTVPRPVSATGVNVHGAPRHASGSASHRVSLPFVPPPTPPEGRGG